MNRKIELAASFTGKISTGSFENESPYFLVKETLEGELLNITDSEVQLRLKELNTICYDMFKQCEQRSIADKIKKERDDIRFYEFENYKLPSVTSILGWDTDFFCSKEELLIARAQGNINHGIFGRYAQTKTFPQLKDLPECARDIGLLRKYGKDIEFGDVKGLIETYPMDFILSEKTVYNLEALYAGTLDATGRPVKCAMWDKVNNVRFDVLTIFDLKRTADPRKNFKQMAAYAKGLQLTTGEKVEQMIILPVNDKTKQGFSTPIISCDVELYYKAFLEDRKAFRERFGI